MANCSKECIHPLGLEESKWLRIQGAIVSKCCEYYPIYSSQDETTERMYWVIYLGRCGLCDRALFIQDVKVNDNLD